ncbi:unnamed protein product (macronuclear) [Paramecium tetraurelia]|uniref:Gamma carbonic anhydrase n=1 Tax=Paramecium tetraurelia TaxID=5888 RepID=A0C1Y1_PARTE|nr:uncharacterized protein GSPATT00034275001 [Paramecium tetraurelia]CAK64798.1 unnamed protein product [Paramecium tetraurelia]|eukprot:XP_001432195.1 hypothetical protein (macronuclear) [Paramecium tetraurelia strain d4-2]
MKKIIRPLVGLIQRSFQQAAQPVPFVGTQPFIISKHRNIMALYDLTPEIGSQHFIASTATVIGDVELASQCVVWYGAVLRGDLNGIRILNRVIIGERSVLHTAASLPNGMPAVLSIGNNVMVQNDCTLYSCTIGDNCFIGYRSIILEGAKLEDGAVLAPGTVVPPGRLIPSNQLWAGNPAQYVRDIEDKDLSQLSYVIGNQFAIAREHDYEYLPYNSAYLQKENSPEDSNPELVATLRQFENWEEGQVKL